MDKNYSLDALATFLDYAAEKGLVKRNTATSRKRAAFKILSVLEDSEKSDLRNIDVDHTFDRFTNLQGTEFKPDSLKVFKSRLRSALTDFFAYVESPSTFKPSGAQRNSTKRSGAESNQTQKKQADSGNTTIKKDEHTGTHTPQHLVIPIPLRDELTVKVHNIPADLSKQESEKIAAIIRAYAMPET
ncbi:MAG: hypothetical protein AB2805_07160 [Candidatus Thiodiazotropha sp.]